MTWMTSAACRQVDPDTMYPLSSNEMLQATVQAKAVCRACPVVQQCLQMALLTDEAYGIWGGMTRRERVIVARGGSLNQRNQAAKVRAAKRLSPSLFARA